MAVVAAQVPPPAARRPRRARRSGLLSLRRRRFAVPVCPPTTPEVVARCVPLPVDEVIDLATGLRLPIATATFRVDGGFVAMSLTGRPAAWRANGRIGRSLRPPTRVTVEVSRWTDDVTEIRLRSPSRRLGHWGPRRRRRYFDVTHQAADDLRRHLITSSAVLWRPPADAPSRR